MGDWPVQSKIEVVRQAAQQQAEAAEPPAVPEKLLTRAEVLQRVPVTFPTIWAWMREGKFPSARHMGVKTFWLESEVSAWIRGLPFREYKPLTPTEE
jgi:predicted DNA-binding transcriptional regulator AlpA